MEEIGIIVATLDEKFKQEGVEFNYTDGVNNKFQVICNNYETYKSDKLKTWTKILDKKYPNCKYYMCYVKY